MRLNREHTAAVFVDIQERLFPHMEGSGELLERTELLVKGLQLLKVPLFRTEQYPKGLGPTIPELASLLEGEEAIEKIAFSCCDEPEFMKRLKSRSPRFVIIAGIEAHVCILQTCLDLLAARFVPVLVSDCTSSRRVTDKLVALQRIRQEGAVVTTSESLLFELCRFAGTDEFRALSRLVR